MKFIKLILIIHLMALCEKVISQSTTASDEIYRPQVHFTPQKHWMNDPNGMVYYEGVYHLFFQHYPLSSIWGPMHWGHAVSKDLIHWKHEQIALYPDSLGYIFSGSAVVDEKNTSGFGKKGKPAMVAIFTHHDPVGEKAGKNDFQYQSLAYSTDKGKTWTKYSGNPVLKNPGIKDFRDPKVMWHEPSQKWIMTLATLDQITFYSSPDLKNWQRESEFGKNLGAHGGVWECPDLFTLDDNGKKVWVLIVNINPGGPNQGSATQYFMGDFDGKIFKPFDTETRWLDNGPDEYAGVTWTNTGNRKIFLGWMSNWLYANLVPTETWRSAMTIPRELKLLHAGAGLLVASEPVKELKTIESTPVLINDLKINRSIDLGKKIKKFTIPARLDFVLDNENDFTIVISNNIKEQISIGFDKKTNRFFIDRTKSGKVNFQKDFGTWHTAPRFSDKKELTLSLVIDVASVELFADGGATVMTEIFFPQKPYDQISIISPSNLLIKKIKYATLKNTLK